MVPYLSFLNISQVFSSHLSIGIYTSFAVTQLQLVAESGYLVHRSNNQQDIKGMSFITYKNNVLI